MVGTAPWWVPLVPLIYHAGMLNGLDMSGNSDRRGRSLLGRVIRTKEHLAGLALAVASAILLTALNFENALPICLGVVVIWMVDLFLIIRAFQLTKIAANRMPKEVKRGKAGAK